MRYLRQFAALLAIAAITVACGTSPGASSGGESSQGSEPSTGSQPSQAAASGGGGGGGGGGANGSITYEITGDFTADGELGFVPAASQVSQDSYSLSFTDDENSSTILVISIIGEARALSYGDEGRTIPGAQCDWNLTRQDADGVAGTFNCDNAVLFSADGASGQVDISGSFEARK
jgi:hypothetical protein